MLHSDQLSFGSDVVNRNIGSDPEENAALVEYWFELFAYITNSVNENSFKAIFGSGHMKQMLTRWNFCEENLGKFWSCMNQETQIRFIQHFAAQRRRAL